MSEKDKQKHDPIDENDKNLKEAGDEGERCETFIPEISIEEKLRDELSETKDRFLRLAAEFENYKKIAQREQQNNVRFAQESLIKSLLPIIDNLEQAIVAQKKSSDEKNDILIGVEMVLKQLTEVLIKFGVEIFSAQGLPFDPARHEALCEQEDPTALPGTVVTEYQKGYLLHGRLLRAARVAVAKDNGSK